METTLGWLSLRRCFTSVSLTSRTFLTATWSWPSRPRNTAPCEPLPSHVRSEMFSNGTSHSSSTAHTHTHAGLFRHLHPHHRVCRSHHRRANSRIFPDLVLRFPGLSITRDMVYDPEYTTGLYQREPQTLWTVSSSSECYI